MQRTPCPPLLPRRRVPVSVAVIRRARVAAIAALVLCCLASGSVLAETAVVLPPKIAGTLPPAEAQGLATAVSSALHEQRLELSSAAELEATLAGEPQLKDCDSALCFERLGRLLASQIVVRYRLKIGPSERRKRSDYHMNVEILDVEVGAFGASLTEVCAGCTADQASAQLRDMVLRSVVQTAALPRGTLEIRSKPADATVFVDGTELGITPYKRPAFAGKHRLVLRHTGYRSQQLEVTVDEGQKQRVEQTLPAGEDPVQVVVVEREKKPIYKKWWFWN